MSEKRMPAFRLKYRSKDKQNYDVGVAWPGRFPDSYDVKPQLTNEPGQYPKMALSEALQRVANQDGWLTLQAVGPAKGKQQTKQDDYQDDFTNGEIPF